MSKIIGMPAGETSSTPGVLSGGASTGGAPTGGASIRGASIRGSWKIGEFSGIGVYIHATFLILVAWVLFVYWHASHTVSGMLTGLLFTLALFACVVLHEFGHALAARHYGIGTRDITLLPIGGVSRLERIPDQPKQEFYVAIMGPVVSIAIAVLLYVVLRISGGVVPPLEALTSWTAASFVARLIYANAILAVFNLLPAFPMDGGRIFRALLARFMPPQKATRIAAGVGHAMAVLFAVLGLFMNPLLILIALFIWMGASQEASMAQMKSALEGVSARHMMITNFASLSPDDSLERAVELILHGSQQDFPIVKNGRLVGMLSNKDLLHGLSQRGAESPISQAMRQDCPVLAASDDLQTIMEKLQSSNCRVMPVLERGELVGLFTSENLAEFVMVQSALNDRRAARSDAQPGDDRRSA